MKASIKAIPTFLYVIIGLVVGIMMLFMISKYSKVFFREDDTINIDGSKVEISEGLAKIIQECWKDHRRGLDDESDICKKVKLESGLKIEEKDLNVFLDCITLPNSGCYPDDCDDCSSDYFDDTDKIIWSAEPENTELKISYSGSERKIITTGSPCDNLCLCKRDCKQSCIESLPECEGCFESCEE